MTQLMVGAFYNPHLGAELARADGIDHLAMADPPAASDPWWPVIRERYTLLLHDYLGQLSAPLDEHCIARRGWRSTYSACTPRTARTTATASSLRSTPRSFSRASWPTPRHSRPGSINPW